MSGREAARKRWLALRNVTVERGATEPEAQTAASLAARIGSKWGFKAFEVPPEGQSVTRIVESARVWTENGWVTVELQREIINLGNGNVSVRTHWAWEVL